MVASHGAHFGEEAPISGTRGSGTIFFSGCNMGCIYCQNLEISRSSAGIPAPPEILALFFLQLQHQGCHNINLVTPTHVLPSILEALVLAASEGLELPLVYNSGGYECLSTLELLEGVVDVYMPDFKYWDPGVAMELSGVRDYPATAMAALKEMHRQVGPLVTGPDCLRGLLVRHLVLPGGLSGAGKVFEFIASEVSRDTYVNVMGQYRPFGEACNRPPLDRRLTRKEYEEAVDAAGKAGLRRIETDPGLLF